MVVGIFPDYRYNLSERIRTGEVVTDLARPVTLFWRDVAERYGTALYYLVARFPPVYLTGHARLRRGAAAAARDAVSFRCRSRWRSACRRRSGTWCARRRTSATPRTASCRRWCS